MRRRDLIAMLGATAVTHPIAVAAQRPAMPVVGYVADVTPNPRNVAAVRKGIGEEGFIDGRNVAVEIHTAPGQYDRIHDIVADLVHRQVAVIITEGSHVPLDAARAATSTIPIVAFFAVDPVKDGYVESINRPGGNVTGAVLFTGSSNVLNLKRLELLQALMPRMHTLGLLVGPENVLSETEMGTEQTTMEARGLVVKRAYVTGESDLDAAFAMLARDGVDALLESPAAFFTAHRADLVALAAKYRIPASWEWPDFVIVGGLMSYGPSITDAAHQQGVYAGRILKGDKPGDLPVVLPRTFRLFINAKTARTLGLSLPPMLLARADEVIE